MIQSIIAGFVLLIMAAAWSGLINSRSIGCKSRVLALRSRLVALANNAIIVSITPKGRTTAVADAAFTSRYLIAKRGAYAYSIAIAGQGDAPYGVVPDMTPTTDVDLSYPLPVNILGLNEDTERMICSGALAIDNLLTTDAAGQVRALPGAAGTYWVLGKAKTATIATGDQVEVIPCFPYQVTVA